MPVAALLLAMPLLALAASGPAPGFADGRVPTSNTTEIRPR